MRVLCLGERKELAVLPLADMYGRLEIVVLFLDERVKNAAIGLEYTEIVRSLRSILKLLLDFTRERSLERFAVVDTTAEQAEDVRVYLGMSITLLKKKSSTPSCRLRYGMNATTLLLCFTRGSISVGYLLRHLVDIARTHGDDERIITLLEQAVAYLVEAIERDDIPAFLFRLRGKRVVGDLRVRLLASGIDGCDDGEIGRGECVGEFSHERARA